MKKLLRIVPVLAIILGLGLPVIAHAQALPSPSPSVTNLAVYRNLLSNGDALFVWQGDIPYSSIPAALESDAFVWQLIQTDGVTVLGSTTGYAFNQNGYNWNIYSLYFSPGTIIWGTNYILRLTGSPVQFTTPPVYNFTIGSPSYATVSTTADNQASLASWVITNATDLTGKWGFSATPLTQSNGSAVTLTVIGQTVLQGCIFGLQVMAPAAFLTTTLPVTAYNGNVSDNYTNVLQNQYSGTWVDTVRTAMIAFFNTGYDLGDLIGLGLICLIVLIGNVMLTADPFDGIMDVVLVIVASTRLGIFPLGIWGLVCALCIVYIGAKIFSQLIPR